MNQLKKAMDTRKNEAQKLADEQTRIRKLLNDVLLRMDGFLQVNAQDEISGPIEVLPHQVLVDRNELDSLKANYIALNDRVEDITKSITRFDDDTDDLYERVIVLEAQTRRDSILIHNLPDIPGP